MTYVEKCRRQSFIFRVRNLFLWRAFSGPGRPGDITDSWDLRHQLAEPRLDKIAVRGERVCQAHTLHDGEGDAIRHRPLLIESCREQGKPAIKPPRCHTH